LLTYFNFFFWPSFAGARGLGFGNNIGAPIRRARGAIATNRLSLLECPATTTRAKTAPAMRASSQKSRNCEFRLFLNDSR
jgi:hypothetical protein